MFQLKRPGLLLILVCAGLLVLVACGDTASPTSAPAVTGTTVASQPTSAATTVSVTTPAAMAGMTMTATTPAATTSAASTTMAMAMTTMAAMTTAATTTAPVATSPATTVVAASTSAQVMEVSIENFSFSPADLKIPVGTKVVWTNKDTTAHTVTSDNKLLNSKLLEQGQKFEFTFNEAGTVEYYCVPHPFMKGKITVTSK